MHDGLRRFVQHLNWLYVHELAYYELDDTYEGFEWIDSNDSDNTVWSFMRKGRNQTLVFVDGIAHSNFAYWPHRTKNLRSCRHDSPRSACGFQRRSVSASYGGRKCKGLIPVAGAFLSRLSK